MSRFSVIFALVATFLTVRADSQAPTKHLSFELNDADIVTTDQKPITKVSEDEVGFIGDLVVGKRHADETIYRRTMEVKNYDPVVSFYSVDFSVKSGNIHYLSVRNNRNSYAVVCDGPFTLGKSTTRFIVRVLPRTESFISIELATHTE